MNFKILKIQLKIIGNAQCCNAKRDTYTPY